MSTRITLTISLILILAASLAGLLLWDRLPDLVASHWNEHNQVDGYMSKFWGVFLMPLVTIGMLALFLVIPSIDPLKANIAQFREAFNLFIALIIAFMVYIHALTLAWNLGFQDFEMGRAMLPAMGLLFLFIGYLLRKAKRNWFIGIRTPWTLSSDRVWDQTHRLGSILFLACGLLTIASGFFGGSIAFWLLLAPLLGSVVFLVAYSYVLYRRETRP
ncbi:MAG: SdpI family protein [Chloroflexi bacterium]|nr:SdpI family protein [Chloroflexota bacterium]